MCINSISECQGNTSICLLKVIRGKNLNARRPGFQSVFPLTFTSGKQMTGPHVPEAMGRDGDSGPWAERADVGRGREIGPSPRPRCLTVGRAEPGQGWSQSHPHYLTASPVGEKELEVCKEPSVCKSPVQESISGTCKQEEKMIHASAGSGRPSHSLPCSWISSLLPAPQSWVSISFWALVPGTWHKMTCAWSR